MNIEQMAQQADLAQDAKSQWSLEDRIVRRLIPSGHPSYKEMSHQAYGLGSQGYVLLNQFTQHQHYPIVLAARRVPYLHEMRLPDLLKDFAKTKLALEFEEHLGVACDEGYSVAFICDYVKLGFIALHNCSRDFDTGASLLLPLGNKRYLALQTLDSLAKSVNWEPS